MPNFRVTIARNGDHNDTTTEVLKADSRQKAIAQIAGPTDQLVKVEKSVQGQWQEVSANNPAQDPGGRTNTLGPASGLILMGLGVLIVLGGGVGALAQSGQIGGSNALYTFLSSLVAGTALFGFGKIIALLDGIYQNTLANSP